jgi:hypothetical protein
MSERADKERPAEFLRASKPAGPAAAATPILVELDAWRTSKATLDQDIRAAAACLIAAHGAEARAVALDLAAFADDEFVADFCRKIADAIVELIRERR